MVVPYFSDNIPLLLYRGQFFVSPETCVLSQPNGTCSHPSKAVLIRRYKMFPWRLNGNYHSYIGTPAFFTAIV